jgi:hypothetical protein
MNAVLVALVLLAGCASKQIEYIEVRIECALPPLPVLPTLEWDELSGDADSLDRLEVYEARLVDSLNEHREMLRVICEPISH